MAEQSASTCQAGKYKVKSRKKMRNGKWEMSGNVGKEKILFRSRLLPRGLLLACGTVQGGVIAAFGKRVPTKKG